jgi:hypothetical protein
MRDLSADHLKAPWEIFQVHNDSTVLWHSVENVSVAEWNW